MTIICKYFLYFIIYSFIGWLMEVLCKFFEQKKFINRGFLIGPICPIYGYGLLGIILLIGKNTTDILSVFLKSILICSILEYFTSYLMEKLFNARWWDYSQNKFNINGRICLETMIPFGLLGSFVVYVVHPQVINCIDSFNPQIIIIVASMLFIIYILDNIVSFKVMNKIKFEIKKTTADNTELIRKKIMDWLDLNSFLYRHIKSAFPKFKINERNLVNKNE